MTTMSATHLQLDNIRKVYDTKVAVEGLSLDVPRGVIFGIIGPNGAGKTTTIRMVMNITMPDSGRILFEGKPADSTFRDRVGYLPEERGLYKKMTLAEVVFYMAELKDYPRNKIAAATDKWLAKVQLSDYKNRKVEELSKGMQQKLQLVTTILHEPELIILDEIFSGLDPLNIELVKNILLDLKKDGKTILFSTHVMEQAEKLCDHVCMISNGKKVLDGRMADVKARFGKNTVHVELTGEGSFVKSLPGVASALEFNNYYELNLSDGADTNALIRAIAERVTIRRFAIVEPSLYDIFIDLARLSQEEADRLKRGGQ
jgi:ABC-2 type transport system ATP-binding protein